MNQRAISAYAAALLLLSSSLSAVAAAPSAAPRYGIYHGEAVVHALGGAGLMIALDETGRGVATRTFLVATARPLPTQLDLRSSNARVERRSDGLYIALPREHRMLVLSTTAGDAQAGTAAGPGARSLRRDIAWTGLEVTEIDGVTELAEYRGSSQVLLPLEDVEAGRVPPTLRIVVAASGVGLPQNQPGPTSGDGSGCQTSCSVSCGNGSSCTLTCTSGRCGSCTCVTNFGASCTCN